MALNILWSHDSFSDNHICTEWMEVYKPCLLCTNMTFLLQALLQLPSSSSPLYIKTEACSKRRKAVVSEGWIRHLQGLVATSLIYDSICMSSSSLGETSREAGPAYTTIHFFFILQIPTNKTKGAISPCPHADMPDMMANSCWWAEARLWLSQVGS